MKDKKTRLFVFIDKRLQYFQIHYPDNSIVKRQPEYWEPPKKDTSPNLAF